MRLAGKTDLSPEDVELVPMRRRDLRQVLRIESEVYPRPWSAALFLSEISRKSDRIYLVAKLGGRVAGYAGMMLTGAEAHITTIAVDPKVQRRHLGTRLMLAMCEAAIERRCRMVSLEVRKSNFGAQRMYEQFGFRPVGIRRGYYIETNEDAIVMWAEGVDSPDYARRLSGLRAKVASRSASA
jgi:ribosomal-protein-alanine N-acetyltransferase